MEIHWYLIILVVFVIWNWKTIRLVSDIQKCSRSVSSADSPNVSNSRIICSGISLIERENLFYSIRACCAKHAVNQFHEKMTIRKTTFPNWIRNICVFWLHQLLGPNCTGETANKPIQNKQSMSFSQINSKLWMSFKTFNLIVFDVLQLLSLILLYNVHSLCSNKHSFLLNSLKTSHHCAVIYSDSLFCRLTVCSLLVHFCHITK